MLICLKNVQKEIKIGNRFLLRYLSVLPNIEEGVDNNHHNLKKKYSISRKDRLLKAPKNNFINNLFLGQLDTEILKCSFFNNDQPESLLQHIKEIQNYLNTILHDATEVSESVLNSLLTLELFGLTVPQNYGGLGYFETETNFIYEHLGICPKIFNVVSHYENFSGKILKLYGTEKQKSEYLPKLASGKCFISLAYLENGPLADLTSLQCTLTKNEEKNCFFLNGEKKLVANVNISDHIFVLSKSRNIEEKKPKIKFNLNLVQKNAPGVIVEEIQSNKNELLKFYNIKLDNVVVHSNSFISNDINCGISIVKSALSYNNLSASMQCLSQLKKILKSASTYCTNVLPTDKSLSECEYMINNIKWLTIYTYALESVIYLISEWFDEFDRPELFAECALTKALAIDMLKSGIYKYLQILGTENYKVPSFLEEILQVLSHMLFDENNFFLKSSIGCYGVLHASRSSSHLLETVKINRQPYNHPAESLVSVLRSDERKIEKIKSLLKISDKFHPFLQKEADILCSFLATLRFSIEKHLINFGNKSTESDNITSDLAEIATYIFTFAACISRASSSIYNKRPSSTEEVKIVKVLASEISEKIINLQDNISYQNTRPYLYKKIGNIAFNTKKYPMEHPLARSF